MPVENELSRPLRIDRIAEAGQVVDMVANEKEREAVARRLELLALAHLSASGTLEPDAGGKLIRLAATVKAQCTQQCVVTMQPVATNVNTPIERCFHIGDLPQTIEIVVDERDDEPEPLTGNEIDLGEIVVEELSLALDPYPRAAEAPMSADEPAVAEPVREHPFAALAALRIVRD